MGHGIGLLQQAGRASRARARCFRSILASDNRALRFNFRRRDSENGIELSNLENFHIGRVDVAEEERYLLFVGLLLEGDERAQRGRGHEFYVPKAQNDAFLRL